MYMYVSRAWYDRIILHCPKNAKYRKMVAVQYSNMESNGNSNVEIDQFNSQKSDVLHTHPMRHVYKNNFENIQIFFY